MELRQTVNAFSVLRREVIILHPLAKKPTFAAENKGATDCSVAPRLVPSPRYFAKRLLQSRQSRTTSSRRNTGGARVNVTDYTVRIRAEATYAALTY